MTDELLEYYDRELAYFRKLGAEFSRAYPKVAGRLNMKEGKTEDPHVSRMIEAFAYLNARTRHKIEDEFPEISESLLSVLYPHYLAPCPSAAIVRFALDRGQAENTEGHTIDRHSLVETEPIEGMPCRFRTCYPVTVWPLELSEAGFRGQPLPAPMCRFTANSRAVIRFRLESFSKEIPLDSFSLGPLRFFLHGHDPYVYELYESLFNNVIGIAIGSSAADEEPVELDAECIQPVGFGGDEGLLDYSARSFLGYRLLTEYFVFPEKFLFFDLQGLSPQVLSRAKAKSHLEIFVFLDRHSRTLERNVEPETFQLGCCPMVNLFRHVAEPIELNQAETEYRVVPDARRPLAFEVYSVDRVVATSPDGEEVEYLPFYSVKHHRAAGDQRQFWYAARRPGTYEAVLDDFGSEVYLTLVDLDYQLFDASDWTLHVDTTCLSRDLPRRLPFGEEAISDANKSQPFLQLASGGPLARVTCVTRPTATLRPALRRGTIWRLISHLSLNHLSLADGSEGADALRNILQLYDLADSAETRKMIEGLLNVRSRRVVGRVNSPVSGGFCRGLEITLDFDEDKFRGSGLFLFAAILDRFLGMYSSINSFTKTIALSNKREGHVGRWPPRAGEKVLL